MRKTWKERLNVDKKPVVKVLEKRFADMPEGCRMVVVTPRIVDQAIRKIKSGKSMTFKDLRKQLAKTYDVDYACPISTGIFVRVAAEAAYEEWEAGTSLAEITPFWRIMDEKTPTAKKLTFDMAFITEQRRKEGL